LSSLIKAQFNALDDNEVLDRAAYLKSKMWRLMAEELTENNALVIIDKLQRLRKKFSWVLIIIAERNLAFEDDGLLESAKQKIIDIAREFKICPLDFGETFESLGVKDPWTFKKEVSVIDLDFQEKKDHLKKVGIQFIKENPSCTEEDLQNYLDNNFSAPDAALGKYLMIDYQEWAYKRELISENTFEAFRDFIVETPIEVLESL